MWRWPRPPSATRNSPRSAADEGLPWVLMNPEASPLAAAVPGLVRSDPHGPGITRARDIDGVRYLDPAGAEITDAATLGRIQALRIPPAWADVWISPDPAGHIQATGTDSKGRLQYLYHRLWREQRDAQKFGHMLRFADALPRLRTAATADLRHRGLTRDRVVASVVRLIDLGMFRIGGKDTPSSTTITAPPRCRSTTCASPATASCSTTPLSGVSSGRSSSRTTSSSPPSGRWPASPTTSTPCGATSKAAAGTSCTHVT